jgi:NAD-dependent DNA ligase
VPRRPDHQSVSKKTSTAVGDEPGSKADDARRLGVAILDDGPASAMTPT